MEDKVSDGDASVVVQKLVMMDGKYAAVDYTFYVALFADQDCTVRLTNVKPLEVKESYTASTIFTKLQYGTYYVAETYEYGNAISSSEVIASNQIVDGAVKLTPSKATAKSTIINHIMDLPVNPYMDGSIIVDKRVLINGSEGNVDDTFYFALFTDAALTNMFDTGIAELELNNESSGTVTFEGLPYGEYYLAKVDENGVPVGDGFGYNVTISSYCKLDITNSTVTRTVVNSKTGKTTGGGGSSTTTTTTATTTTGGKTTTGTKPVKTGDSTPIEWLVFAMAASAAALAALLAMRRRKKKNA